MSAWSQQAWDAAEPIYRQITELPFLRELAEGTLAAEKFHFYISQDSLYLDQYTRVLSHIASRLPDMADVETFLHFAVDGVEVEKALHAGYQPDRSIGMSEACLFYTSLLRAQATADVAVEAAAILPCFWVYQRVGEHILATAKLDGNRYANWITTYGDESFDISTRRAIALCDKLAAETSPEVRQRMTEIFVQCTRMELLFWRTAYDQQMQF